QVVSEALSLDPELALTEAPASHLDPLTELLGQSERVEASPAQTDPLGALSVAAKVEETTAQPTAVAHAPAGQMEGSVRVDFLRLERLNNLVGELVTQENGSLLQAQQLQSQLKVLQQRFATFEQLSKTLQTWMDESLKTGIGRPKTEGWTGTSAPPKTLELASLAEFDPLQMDSYSVLYTLMQDALEEIAQMGETMGDMTLLTQQAQQNQRRKQQTLKQVRNDLLWARMMPIGDILRRFPRMVRDLATQQHKKVVFKQTGTNTLVDKAILERLYDPLVHLIRNAFDHGTETPEERQAKGKPPEATIEIRAYHRGNQTFIELRDDGRGIDPEKVRESAASQKVLTPQAAAAATPEQLYQCLFESSFSTKDAVSELSGRGMGLSAVQIQVQALKGKISIYSQLGQGTTFTICLPLTLTIAKLLVFSVDTYFMAIPVDTLLAIVSADPTEISTVQGRQFYRYQERLVPLYPPSAFSHHYPLPRGLSERRPAIPIAQANKIPLLLIANGDDIL
ncbi:MAG: ATP-binding protein, partial [Thermosynechococcaceae cyanobacterium]